MCEQIILQFLGKYFSEQSGGQGQHGELSLIEKEICRLALSAERAVTPRDLCELFRFEAKKSRRILRQMMGKNLLVPAGEGNRRIKCYRLHPAVAVSIVSG